MNETEIKNGYSLLSINEIFAFGKRAFTIPDYQRGYSWEKPQRNDLLKDLEYILEGNYRHYTGTIVATPSAKQNGSISYFDIIDGQQRLTTIIILLFEIYRKFKNSDSQTELINRIPEIFLFSGEDSGNTCRKFLLQKEQDEMFHKYLFKEELPVCGKNKAEQNIIDAVTEFREWIGNHTEILPKIVETIVNNLGFLFYTPEKSNEIGIMFEVINNRGKTLSELEKVKNYLIYYSDKNGIQDLKNDVNLRWGNIINHLNSIGYHSNDSENSFLRNCWLVFKEPNKQKSFYVYYYLKEYYHISDCSKWNELIEFVGFIECASETYYKLFSRNNIKNDLEKYWLERIALHPSNASVIPLILAIYSKELKDNERIELLEIIEKLNFRYYVTGIAGRSDSGQGSLFSFANDLYKDKEKKAEWLKEKLLHFINDNADDKIFIQYLTVDKDEKYDYYNWQGLKFFLASYEEKLRSDNKESINMPKMLAIRDEKFPNDFYHREHIWARKDFSRINDEEEPDRNKRRIGNFVLLKETQNIKVSNNPPEKKIELYWEDRFNDPNTLMIRELRDSFLMAQKETNSQRTKKTWKYWYDLYQKFIDIREEKLINFALSRWKVPLPKSIEKIAINSFKDTNEVYEII